MARRICMDCGWEYDEVGPDDVATVSGDEVFELIAEAAKTSTHAKRAYQLLREINPAIPSLEARWRLMENRMKETA